MNSTQRYKIKLDIEKKELELKNWKDNLVQKIELIERGHRRIFQTKVTIRKLDRSINWLQKKITKREKEIDNLVRRI